MADLTEDFRYASLVIPMSESDAGVAVKALEYLTEMTQAHDSGARIASDWPSFEKVCPDVRESLDETGERIARDLYERLCKCESNDPDDLYRIDPNVVTKRYANKGLHIENSTNWMPVDVATAIVQTMQAQLGAPTVRFEYADFSADQIENAFGGGAVRVEPSMASFDEVGYYDTTQLGTEPSNPFKTALLKELEAKRGEFDLTDEFEIENCLETCARAVIAESKAVSRLSSMMSEWGGSAENAFEHTLSDSFVESDLASEMRDMLTTWGESKADSSSEIDAKA